MPINVAGVILIRKDGAVLLMHRDDKPGVQYRDHWCYPGGVMEAGETPKEAALRELLEETNYRTEKVQPLEAEAYVRPDGKTMQPHPHWTMYDGVQKIVCNEGREMIFVSPADFKGKQFMPGQEALIKKALALAAKSNVIPQSAIS